MSELKNIKSKFDKFDLRLTKLEESVQEKHEDLPQEIATKATNEEVDF